MAIAFDSTLASAQRTREARRVNWSVVLLLVPCIGFLLVMFVLPVAYILLLSVTEPDVSLGNYVKVFTVPLYLRILANTFYTSFVVTFGCVVLAYPLAYVMARRDDWLGQTLLGIVAVSFWTGFIVRTYAWLVILGSKGPVVAAYHALGYAEPPRLLFTSFASTLGMIHIMLPYTVLALYGVMTKIDANHLRAAHSLGAAPWTAFRLVYFPLTLPGVVNGSILVFTIVLGFYITPILLGTPQDMMISQLINQQIEQLLNWGFAAALAVVLLLCTMTILAVYNRLVGLDRLWG